MTASTLYKSAHEFEAWFADARPNAKWTYAIGPTLDPREPVVQRVNALIASAELTAHNVRAGDGGLLRVVKRLRPVTLDPHGMDGGERARRISISDEFRETPEGRIYLMLVRAANMGAPCPSNADLAAFAGLKDADQARYLLRDKLIAPGLIAMEYEGAGNVRRRVKIMETGRRSAAFEEMAR
ncbi:MAG: hypothetical protein Q8R81_09550 [Novosphingobium sp.]|uniref:hypothetical protein n=1 Tax=Novosphingobium sp. TaxID=1874826 RepID=UPI0027339C3F|nr:hypothetical protein [Novosphingobium sp.]MDP3550629.1 hypothetical protein [Novosphingobium sp.]